MKRSIEWALVLLLLATFFAQSWAAMSGDAQTSDEAVHLAAGVSYLRTGDRRMNPEHPPLAKLVSALPLLFLDAELPLDHSSWREGNEWTFGARFLYRNRLPAEVLLNWGRVPVLFCGLLLLVLIYLWARALYGPAGALLSLGLAAFEPNLLAHCHYVTNDALLSLFYCASLYALWRFRRSDTRLWLVLSGLAVGLALGTKYSALLLLPLVPLLLWPGVSPDPRAGAGRRIRSTVLRTFLVGVLAYLVLACLYQGEPLSSYWAGYRSMQSGWTSFLCGEISTEGWYHYFVVAFLLKTTPATVLLILAALVLTYRMPLRGGEGILLLGAAWFFVISSILRINIGIRHILPVYPLLLIFAGRLMSPELGLKRVRWAFVGLALVSATEVGIAYPYYLSYFSSVVGGPFQGYRYLSDSNLDWGQDLKRLARWVRQEKLEGVLLGVFSSADPAAYGLNFMPVPGFGAVTYQERPLRPLPSRLVLAISELNLQGTYFTQPALFHTRVPIGRDVYHFLFDHPLLKRVTPSIRVWDLTDDAEGLYRLISVYLNFEWDRSAECLLERYLRLRPDDTRARRGLDVLRQRLGDANSTEAPPAQPEAP